MTCLLYSALAAAKTLKTGQLCLPTQDEVASYCNSVTGWPITLLTKRGALLNEVQAYHTDLAFTAYWHYDPPESDAPHVQDRFVESSPRALRESLTRRYKVGILISPLGDDAAHAYFYYGGVFYSPPKWHAVAERVIWSRPEQVAAFIGVTEVK